MSASEDSNSTMLYDFEMDEAFMAWLRSDDPNWDCEYSGNLRRLYSAFNAGREAPRFLAYDATVLSANPVLFLLSTKDA